MYAEKCNVKYTFYFIKWIQQNIFFPIFDHQNLQLKIKYIFLAIYFRDEGVQLDKRCYTVEILNSIGKHWKFSD